MITGSTQPELFTQDTLIRVVRIALNQEQGRIANWSIQAVHGGASTLTGSLTGIYRVTGSFQRDSVVEPWSVILKAIGKTEQGSTLTSPSYWRREPLIYQSGLRNDLPLGLAMPRCFAVDETEAMCWIWLEDLGEMRSTPWRLEQYGHVAYRLGQFNGSFLTQKSLPSWDWLCHQWLRSWVADATLESERLPSLQADPLIQQWFPPRDFDRVTKMWERREGLLRRLESLPHTLCHLDANRRNMIWQPQGIGEEILILIDWSSCGIAALGEELACLIWSSYFLFEVDSSVIDELEKIVIQNYMAGLRNVGWQGSEQEVHIGYVIGSAFRNATALGIESVLDSRQHATIEQIFGQPLDVCLARWADVNHRVLNRLDQL